MKKFKELANEPSMACVYSIKEYNDMTWHMPQLHTNNLYNNFGYRYKRIFIEYYEKF